MHCWKCEGIIETTGGMYEIINYDLSKAVYSFKQIMVIECPYCELLIGITNYDMKELQQTIKIDPSARRYLKGSLTKMPL